MHTIDLSKYEYRTDLVIEEHLEELTEKDIQKKQYKIGNIQVEEMDLSKEGSKKIKKKEGLYRTISFQDITDKDHYQEVEKVFIKVMKELLQSSNIKEDASTLIVGLGNEHSTPDALGPKVVEQVLVTSHLFELGEVEKTYRKTSAFSPDVTGSTGIETGKLIKGAIHAINPDFLIVIDALKATNTERLTKTIQLSNTGITPGSGVGNNREELSYETLKIPVIVIGVPTIVDLVTIVTDTFQYIYKHFSYKLDNLDNASMKLIPESLQNYLDYPDTLTKEEKEEILGSIGNLEEEEVKQLMSEVLVPINYNLMVTPKEIDFTIKRLSTLIGQGINKSLHIHFNPTKRA